MMVEKDLGGHHECSKIETLLLVYSSLGFQAHFIKSETANQISHTVQPILQKFNTTAST